MKIADKKKTEICFVVFRTFELVSSGPMVKESFRPTITFATPSGQIINVRHRRIVITV